MDKEDKFVWVCGMLGLLVTPYSNHILDSVCGQCSTDEVCIHAIIFEVCSGLLGFAIGPVIGAFIGVFLYETLYITIPHILTSINTRLFKYVSKSLHKK